MYCYKDIFDASFLSSRQQAVLTVVNLFAMIGNIIANALVIYIVIKTGKISQIASKLVLMLSGSNILLALLYHIFFSIFTSYFKLCNCNY